MSCSLLNFVADRGLGRANILGYNDAICSSLYSKMAPVYTSHGAICDWGAVYGFGFSPDGCLMAAACENKSILLYDPVNARLIQKKYKVHTDCVNGVRFLDNRMFATYSDDTTVRLWDARFLTSEIRRLQGHSSWVKSVEYAPSQGKLVTSGFDGNVIGWNVNDYSNNENSEPLFNVNGLMRTRIAPSENKMIASTLGGYFIVIHDLQLENLKYDMLGFRPHSYRMMQLMGTPFHRALKHNHMFTRKRNRVEFIADFPVDDIAEHISSMQVHPHGWCIASRNVALHGKSEWTCIHDIQEISDESKCNICRKRGIFSSRSVCSHAPGHPLECEIHGPLKARIVWTDEVYHFLDRFMALSHFCCLEQFRQSLESETTGSNDGCSAGGYDLNQHDDNTESYDTLSEGQPPQTTPASSETSTTTVPSTSVTSDTDLSDSAINKILLDRGASIAIEGMPRSVKSSLAAPGRLSLTFLINSPPEASNLEFDMTDDLYPRGLVLYEASKTFIEGGVRRLIKAGHTEDYFRRQAPFRISDVKPRLLFYSEEPNVARGLIKELSFSADGRVIASPFGNGVRLLAFNNRCSELCDNVPEKPTPLTQVGFTLNQNSSTLASIFSPTHCLLVSGSRDGSVSFWSPKL